MNVGCAIWGAVKVENLSSFIWPIVEMAIIDSGSIIIATALLWRFCHVNILQEYCKVMKKYWIYLALSGGTFVAGVSEINQSLECC